MNEMLDKKLCEKYPKIFVNRNASAQTTAMCWGFAHGDGWYDIVNNLCGCIQHHIDSTDSVPQVVAQQVKEKFGTLRFYYTGGDEYIRGLVSMAQAMSGVISEDSNAAGESDAVES
jgi:hypothetical protein